MDLAEDLPPNSAAAVTSKQRCRPRAALAFRAGRQWVITRPGSCGRGRGGPSSDGNVTTGLRRPDGDLLSFTACVSVSS